ncbi:hypothetical protein M472_11410 [Sphingobacterium paucimobilis HER1398]|uniref:DUF11 domain-containing protein n=2 Tax=Sphingobacterium TaxID=28453 RepID=U2HC99_9SPHI|nr:hypothetical protein M472_11410 [Sphingobacterium paucimobilis HER1398]
MPGWARGQVQLEKVYANTQTNGKNSKGTLLGLGGDYSSTNDANIADVADPNFAVDGNENTSAVMKAKNVSLLVAGVTGESWLQMDFSATVQARTTTYIKIDEPETTGSLLSLDLLRTVGGLLGLLSENIVITEAYNGDEILSNTHATIVEGADGNVYIAVTPQDSYNGVRLKLRSQSSLLKLSLGGGLQMNVYEAFHYTTAPNCGRPLHTYYEDSGLKIDLLGFNNRNLKNAIDGDDMSFSSLKQGSLLGINVAGSQSQVFNFGSSSSVTSTLNIKLMLGSGGVLNADLLGAAEVILYNKGAKVYQRSLQSSLLNNTDLLNLLQNGKPVTMTFAPGMSFDQAEVRLASPVGVSLLGDALKIYDVQRYDGIGDCINPLLKPTPLETSGPFEEASCASSLVDFDNVDFPHNAVDGNNETYATLHADAGGLLVSGPTAGFIEMNLGQVLPANKTTYVRVNYDQDVLDKLLGGSLGKLVSDLANGLLLGNQFFEVEAKNGQASVLKESSSNAFAGKANGVVTLVQDSIGRYYLAVTPSAPYNSIRITNHVKALLATGKKASLDVYNACFEIGTDACFPANFTSYRGGGIGLNVGNISTTGVENPYRAISANSSEYSKINLGVVGVAAHVYQTIYFNQPSQAGDKVKIRLQIEPSSLLSLDLLGAYKIKFFNGKDQVGSDYTLQAGLINNIDLLALFRSGGIAELEFEPSGTFDRVDIGAESLVSLNLAAEPLRVYSVKRFGATCPETKEESPFVVPSCATLLVDAQNADDVQNLFDDDFGSFATLKSGSGILLGLGNKYEGSVELGYNHIVPAGKTSYIRVDFEDTLLEKLLGGSLGNVVSGLVNGLVLGDHFFEVEVKNNGTRVDFASSQMDAVSNGGNNTVRIVRDKDGRYYIAVTPTEDYNSVRITDKTNSLVGLLAQPNTMNVYGMCYETSTDQCLNAFSTSYEHSGLSLSVNDLGGAGVTNPQYALNDNTTNASQISNGTLGVGAVTKQWIFFNSVSAADDVAMIKFKTGAGVADVAILGGLKIKAYLGHTEVASVNWGATGIVNGIDVLDLIKNGSIVELPFAPGVPYDRISVGIESLLNVSVFPPVELYSVTRCFNLDAPNFVAWKSADKSSVKGGEEVTYSIHIENKGTRDLVNYIIEDKIPAHTTYVPSSGGVYNSATNSVSFENVTVLAGKKHTLTFKVKVNSDLTGVQFIRNVALVKNSPTDKGVETFPPLDTDPNQPDTEGEPGTKIPVEVVKSVVSWKAYEVDGDKTMTAVSGREEVTYHIYVRNTGNQELTGVQITDVLPAGVTWKSGGAYAGGAVKFTIPTLKVGTTSETQSFVVTVNSNLTGITEIKNIAVVKLDPNSSDPGEESFPPINNEDPTEPNTTTPGTTLTVDAVHSVGFLKTGLSNGVNTREAQENDEIIYSLTVKNTGNTRLEDVYVTDTIPQHTTHLSGGTLAAGVVTLPVGDLAYGESKTVTFTVTVGSLTADPDNPVTAITNLATAHFKDAAGADKTEDAEHIMLTNCTAVDASNVNISQNGTFCEGSPVTLTVDIKDDLGIGLPAVADFTVKWFADAALTDYIGDGASLDVTPVAGAKYYVILEHNNYCFNGAAAEWEVAFLPTATAADITVNADGTELCEGTEAVLIAEASGVPNAKFKWYADTDLTLELPYDTLGAVDGSILRFLPTAPSTTVYVTVSGDGFCDNKPGDAKAVTIGVKPAPVITLSGSNVIYVATGATITWPTATASAGTIQWYDEKGQAIDYNALPAKVDTVAQLAYTVVATDGDCSASETIVVNVYDGQDCPPQMERVYATVDKGWGSIITGGVTETGNATDGNPKTHSRIITGVGLLGIGTAWQNIEFDHEIKAGTPVTIKLGKEYSGLTLAGGLSVQGIGVDGKAFGSLKPVDGALLDLLVADNVVEFTFVPADRNGPKAFKGVRVTNGALLSVAQISKVYGAYYNRPGQADCEPIDNNTNTDVLDVLHGVEDLGLGVASATASVVSPWKAVDNDLSTSAKLVRGVAVLNAANLTVVFKNQVMPTDSLRIIMKDITNKGLNLNLLTGFRFQRYLGGQKAGNPIQGLDVLNLALLNFKGDKATMMVDAFAEPYDRLQIALGSIVQVGLSDQVEIFDVAIQPTIKYGSIDGKFEICAGEDINFERIDECTTYKVYDQGGNPVDVSTDGMSFTIPNNTVTGDHTYYVQAMRYGCGVGVRIPITITVNAVPVIDRIEINEEVHANNEITLAPGEEFKAKAFVSENGAKVTSASLQMLDIDGDWVTPNIGVKYGDYEAVFDIPANGIINGVDYRNKSVQLRMLFQTNKGCAVESEIITLNISSSKYDFTGENLKKVAKDGVDAKAVAGEEFVYTVTVKNGGPSTINAGTLLYIQDLPSEGQELRSVVATSANITLGGGNSQGGYFVRAESDIIKDAIFTFDVTTLVDRAIKADFVDNTFKIWTKDPNGNYNDVNNPADGSVTSPQYEVIRKYGFDDDAITKVGDAPSAVAGKPYSYTVTVNNNGPSTIMNGTSIYFQDVVSAGQKLVSVTSTTGTASLDASTGLFTLVLNKDIAKDASFTLNITVDVDAGAPKEISNTIHIWQDNPGSDVNNLPVPDGTATTDPIPVERDYGWGEPGAVVKVGDAVEAIAGEEFSYTVTLTNKGASTILDGTELRLQDVVSAGQTITGIISDKGVVSPVDANGFFTLTVNQDVVVTEQIKLTVVVDVDPDAQVNTVHNTINIWEDKTPITDGPDGTDTTDPIPVAFNAKFTVTKTTDAIEAVAGEKVKYDVVLTNAGPSTAKIGKEILVIETPGNMVITTADIKVMSGNAELDGNYDASTGEFTLKVTKDVKLTEQIVLEIYAMVPANATGMVKNGVKVDDDEEETPEIPVVDKVKFAVQKTVAAGQNAVAGEQIDFDVILTNNGPSTAKPGHKVLVIEKPGPFLTITAADIKVTSGNANLFEGKYNEVTGEFTLVVTNEVDLGATINMTVTAHIAEEATGTIKNGIKVEDEETETPPIPVDNKAKFGVKKTANKTEVFVGDIVDFKVVLTNNGPSTAQIGHEIKVVERPDGMTITAADIAVVGDNASFDGNYNQTTGEFTIKVTKPVAVGGAVELNIKGHVPLDATGTVKNGIEVDDDTDETPEIPVVSEAKMKIVKVADESTVKAGEMTTFTLTITNQGPATAQSGKTISLVERPGAGLSIKNYEMISSNATVQGSDNQATLTTSQVIGVGEEIKVRVHVLVSEDAPEEVINGISVWGPGKDPDTDPEDDKDDTDPTPVEHQRIQAVDDVAETNTAVPVEIDVLANDIVTKWDIDKSTVEIVNSSSGAIITVGIDGTVTYESSRDMIGEDTFTYRVKDVKGRWSNTATVRVTVSSNNLDIPNIITPNGDGKNDEFRIKGLEIYDRVGLTIVNRWGNEVYKTNAYNNDWNGFGLSEGTYFYVLELVKAGKKEVHKGWVTIKSN